MIVWIRERETEKERKNLNVFFIQREIHTSGQKKNATNTKRKKSEADNDREKETGCVFERETKTEKRERDS